MRRVGTDKNSARTDENNMGQFNAQIRPSTEVKSKKQKKKKAPKP
jgi:hypothetical protein